MANSLYSFWSHLDVANVNKKLMGWHRNVVGYKRSIENDPSLFVLEHLARARP